ncbi:acyl transferase carnitine dehydratase [Fusarium mundagurra]|uniref:Acyl transferase carnitine dehydratase n=1 Tax=Fusarium mundagurra TaxID=1567541 RepID=A0A8H6D693_9HYPO|nr:acyl transferase carnitine dehydratase [Fusarium mundagurra]
MAGVVADEILTLRGVENKKRKITVNTTHASLWFGNIATAWMTLQWVLFMVNTTVAYRLPESSNNNSSPTSGSEIELAPMNGPRSMNEPSPERSS